MFVAYSLLLAQGPKRIQHISVDSGRVCWKQALQSTYSSTYTMIPSFYAVICARRALIVNESARDDKIFELKWNLDGKINGNNPHL